MIYLYFLILRELSVETRNQCQPSKFLVYLMDVDNSNIKVSQSFGLSVQMSTKLSIQYFHNKFFNYFGDVIIVKYISTM